MAKLAFSKLGLNKIKETESKQINFNDQVIEIKQYLPINEKIKMISEILSLGNDGVTFKNPIQLELYTNIGIIKYYTNINFTDKQLEDVTKIYDLMESSNFFNLIIDNIPSEEYNYIINTVETCADDLVKYYNSARGIVEMLINSNGDLIKSLEENQEKISNPETFAFVKNVLDKLG